MTPKLRSLAALALAAALPILGSGCSDSSTAPLPPPVDPQYMTAIVSGDYYAFSATLFEADFDPDSRTLIVRGVDHYNLGQPQIAIQIFDYEGPGRYALGSFAAEGVAEYDSYTRGNFRTTAFYQGYIDIDFYDPDRLVVGGTFEFDAVDPWGFWLTVRNGVYEVPGYIVDLEADTARLFPREGARAGAPIDRLGGVARPFPTATSGKGFTP